MLLELLPSRLLLRRGLLDREGMLLPNDTSFLWERLEDLQRFGPAGTDLRREEGVFPSFELDDSWVRLRRPELLPRDRRFLASGFFDRSRPLGESLSSE
jgi:hypothetical protein